MKDYVSIIIPYFCRPAWLLQLIDSIHQYADLPFELLIHDDGSTDGSQNEVLSYALGKASTMVFSTGPCLGLAASANRLVKLCSSDYIMLVGADFLLTRPYLREVLSVLKRPYVGVMGTSLCGAHDLNIVPSGSGDGHIAFRKDVWDEVKGFDENMYTLFAGFSFIYRVAKRGYFIAAPKFPRPFVDGNAPSTIGTMNRGFDNSFPMIFDPDSKAAITNQENRTRAADIHDKSYESLSWEASEVNEAYWVKYFGELVGLTPSRHDMINAKFDWSKDRHGHSRWRHLIERDIAAMF